MPAAEAAAVAEAPQAPEGGSRIEGDLEKWPKVSLSFEDVPAGRALAEIAKQLGLGFVAPKTSAEEKRIAVTLQKRPGREALEVVLEIAEMRAQIRNGVLIVVAEAKPPAAPPTVPEPAVSAPTPPADEADDRAMGHGNRGKDEDEDDGDEDRRDKKRKRDKRGEHGEVVKFGEPIRIEKGEVVDEAVAMGGLLTVAGHVRGDAVSMGGGVVLEDSAEVDGDVVSFGGELKAAPGATVHGDRVSMGGSGLGSVIGAIAGKAAVHEKPSGAVVALLLVGVAFFKCVILLVVALLVTALFPERYARVRERLVTRPGKSALAGGIAFLAIVPLCIVLAVTLVGIPLIPVVFLILAALMALGLTAFVTWLGDRLPIMKGRKSQFVSMLLGVAVVFLVSLIPVLGGLAIFVASLISGGAALLTRFGAPPKAGAAPRDEEPAPVTVE